MTFKAKVYGALASVLACGAAFAADLPSMKAPPVYAPPVWTWTGWHIGVSGSYAGGSAYSNSTLWTLAPAAGVFNFDRSVGTSGFLVGVQSGYTWQMPNNYVVGYESEFNYADVRSDGNGAFFAGDRSRIEWFGAERLRFGYAMGRFLPYITGGLAYARYVNDGANFGGAFLLQNNASKWHAGWTVGAGLEYALWDKVSVKAEYLFSRIDGPTGASIAPGVFRSFRLRDLDTHVARIGVNYQIKSFGEILGIPGLGI